MSTTKLVICGSIAIDRIMNFSGNYHELIDATKLEVLSLSVLVDSLTISEGGIGANIAYYLANLGEQPALLGSVGTDAKEYIQRLSNMGIDTSGVHESALPTASFNVLTDHANNQVGGFYPGAMGDSVSLQFAPWATEKEHTIFCLSAHDPLGMRRQLEECADQHLRLVYDPSQQVSNVPAEDLQLGIGIAEVLIVNEYELSVLIKRTGLTAAQLRKRVPLLITTLGKRGSKIYANHSDVPVEIEIARPETIVDPTGAGDAYRAGFFYGYLRQWDVKQCGRLGSVIASFALEHNGPQAEISKDKVLDRYQQTYNERITL